MLWGFANLLIAAITLWALAAALAAMLDLTVYFPWVVMHSGEIPPHRLAAIRVGVLLTFAYFGFLHIFGRSIQLYPINFLTTFLFNLVLGGTIVFLQISSSSLWVLAVSVLGFHLCNGVLRVTSADPRLFQEQIRLTPGLLAIIRLLLILPFWLCCCTPTGTRPTMW